MHQPIDSRSRVIFCRGARDSERRLLEEIDRLTSGDGRDLVLPVRVVVPSRSLRHHLVRTVARRRGAVAGLHVQTLFGLAMDVLARCGRQAPRGNAAFELAVRRLAANDPILHDSLDTLAEGYDAVVGAVRDLLDAGFQAGNEDGVLERLDDARSEVAAERIARSRSLVRLAAAAATKAQELGLERSLAALQMAEEELVARGPEALPARTILVHGFADVTGVAADLLVALLRIRPGTVILDRPPDPAKPEAADLGGAYLSRLDERLVHLDRQQDESPNPPPEITFAEAPDVESETRWIAEQVRGLIDRGIEPEGVGIVGRNLEAMALPLRRHFRRLGVPFSGEGIVVAGSGPWRRLRRLAELITRGSASEADLWVETRAHDGGTNRLLLGLRVLGILRLSDLAELPAGAVPSGGVRLPVAMAPDDDTDDVAVEPKRLSADQLLAAVSDAGSVVAHFRGWPSAGGTGLHRQKTLDLLPILGWLREAAESAAVRENVDRLVREFPDDFAMTRSEWIKLLADSLHRAGNEKVGGNGAGVQLLTVMESRARTFDHLFIAGLNRGVFPRVGHEDAMLPEALRVRLAADVLPEMPVKGRSADEERYLFAQLVSSSPAVTLSWHVFGRDGTTTPSPFVDRIRKVTADLEVVAIKQLWKPDDESTRPRPVYELAVLGALAAGTDGARALLEPAIEEGRAAATAGGDGLSPTLFAAARSDLLSAIERRPDETALSPWFGVSIEDARPGRADGLWVTHLERLATCPWRSFVERRLDVAALPDPHLGLPPIDGLAVGRIVHGVLERIVGAAAEEHDSIEAVLSAEPVDVRWPPRKDYEELLADVTERVCREGGLGLKAMARLLEARANELLQVARSLEWGEECLAAVLAAEIEGSTEVDGVDFPVRFRADRADAGPVTVELVDYKTSKPLSEARGESYRRAKLLKSVSTGRVLQAAAYAHATGVEGGRGRYAYLRPNDDWGDEVRQVVVDADDDELARPFTAAVRILADAGNHGIAFPRVEEADGSAATHCKHCSVAEACRRDDTAFRRDLVRWMQADPPAASPAEQAARSLWWLGVDPPEDGE